jgi:hypothetical protein
MKKRNQVRKNSSPAATTPQSKTAHTKAGDFPIYDGPTIVLFKDHDGGVSDEIIDLSKAEYAALKRAGSAAGSGTLMFMAFAALDKVGSSGGGGNQFCIFDGAVGEVALEIPLAGAELGSVVIAACGKGITADQFIADAIREKLGRQPVASSRRCASIACRKMEAA